MVGGLADWFAITALFKHPLNIPIPHTAIIPTRKDRIGRTLGNFVQHNFLSPEVLGAKLLAIQPSRRVGRVAPPARRTPGRWPGTPRRRSGAPPTW